MKLKKKLIIPKDSKKIAIKRIMIKTQIPNKCYIWLKGESWKEKFI